VLSSLFLIPVIFLYNEQDIVINSEEISSVGFWVFMTVTAVLGFMVNMAYFALVKYTSPLTCNVTGNVKVNNLSRLLN
jgi:hypothetical protein